MFTKLEKGLRNLKNFVLTEALLRVRRIICEYYYKIILPLGLVYAIFCQVIWKVKLLKLGVLFLYDQTWRHLGLLSTLKSVKNGVHDIHVMCINILSIKLRPGIVFAYRHETIIFVLRVQNGFV
jgi:hypothetical protein